MFFLAWVISIVGTVVIAERKNLNVALHCILSIILGPIALLIVSVSTPRPKKEAVSSSPSGTMTPQEAQQQLQGVKTSIQVLMQRVERIEAALGQAPVDKHAGIVSNSSSAEKIEDAKITDSPKHQAPETMEFIFGKYWLNRIGVVLFVIGIGLFINYTFHYFSSWIKIAIGYTLAVLFLVWGQKLEKNPSYHKLAWGILGGAWGLFYLVTYAMYYIPATKVISHPYVEFILLWLVTVLAVQYNLKYKSWVATAMSYLLGFITLSLGGLDATSVVFWAMLLGSLAYLAFLFGWDELLMTGIISAYGVYALVLRGKLPIYYQDAHSLGNFQICMSFIGIAWIIFLVTFLVKQWKHNNTLRMNIQVMSLNTAAFAFEGLMLIDDYQTYDNSLFKFKFLIVVAACHFGMAILSRFMKISRYIVFHCAIAMALISLAVLIKHHELSVTFWWITQMALTFALGLYYKEVTYRSMGWLLGVGVILRYFVVDINSSQTYSLGPITLDHSCVVAVVIAAITGLLGIILHTSRVQESLGNEEKNLYLASFPAAGALVLAGWMWDKSPQPWLTLHWAFLGIGWLVIGFIFNYRVFRLIALVLLATCCFRIICYDLAGVDTIYKIIVVIFLGAALLGVSFFYSRTKQNTE